VVTRSNAHAELVEHLSDVVGMHTLDVETDDAAAISGIARSNDAHATLELQRQSRERIAR